jgi:hypothetical protein
MRVHVKLQNGQLHHELLKHTAEVPNLRWYLMNWYRSYAIGRQGIHCRFTVISSQSIDWGLRNSRSTL